MRRAPEQSYGSPLHCRCRDCHRLYSARTGKAPERSRIPFRKRASAIQLDTSRRKDVSCMNLHRDIGVPQELHDSCSTATVKLDHGKATSHSTGWLWLAGTESSADAMCQTGLLDGDREMKTVRAGTVQQTDDETRNLASVIM